jgi:hypothetical protein
VSSKDESVVGIELEWYIVKLPISDDSNAETFTFYDDDATTVGFRLRCASLPLRDIFS